MRTAEISRKTKETDISVYINLDNLDKTEIDTGVGFFDHMLTALSVHSGIGMTVNCKGDIFVDGHHTVEDIGIVLGNAFRKALGENPCIMRYGEAHIPMDESLAFCCLDISNRPYLVYNNEFTNNMIGNFDTCLAEEFFYAFAMNSKITLHISTLYGNNDHHKCEAMFKALAHALKKAIELNGTSDSISTKGVI
jgi:imidazoleglycerol-phosphate dehydratase